MFFIGQYLGIPKQLEVLLLTLAGICCTIFDASFLDLNANIRKVWQIALNQDKFSGSSQMYLKYMLSGIVLVRTFSVHLYLAFYIVMLWPAIFEERPALLLPWLMVAAIKCLLMGFMSLCIGVYTCFAYGIYKTACADFVVAQLIDHLPSVYMWFSVVSYYRELKTCTTTVPLETNIIDFESEITMRRRKVRSLADNTIAKHCPIDEDRHLISVSTIENIVQQLTTDLHRKTTRSLDSLLGVMAAEAEQEELMNSYEDLPSEATNMTIPARTAKMLKLSDQDIAEAKLRKRLRTVAIFTSSMMSITDVGDRHQLLLKARERIPLLRSDTLRSTKSEKGDLRVADFAKNKTTEFMTDISEVEIGSVYNYSSVSLLPQKPEIKFVRIKPVIDKKILQPLKTLEDIASSKAQPQTSKIPIHNGEPKQKMKKAERGQNFPTKKSDFSCQASTLSKKILGALPSEFSAICNAMSSNKPQVKTILARRCSRNEIKGSPKPETKTVEIGPFKAEISKNNSSFRTDGYTMAYNEKMLNKKTKH